MKTNLLSLGMLCVLVEFAVAAEPLTLKLWPDGPPTAMVPKSEATVKLIQSYGGAGPNRITDVSDPTITIFRPEKPNGTSVLVAPGACGHHPLERKAALMIQIASRKIGTTVTFQYSPLLDPARDQPRA